MGWVIDVAGGSDQEIFIIIEGVGSFHLNEMSPGNYSIFLQGSLFEWEEEYGYHFSNENGGDVPIGFGRFSGVQVMPGKQEEGKDRSYMIVMITLILMLIIILGIGAFYMVVSRNKDHEE